MREIKLNKWDLCTDLHRGRLETTKLSHFNATNYIYTSGDRLVNDRSIV